MPDSQNAIIDRGPTVPRIVTAREPKCGVQPQKVGCSSATVRSPANGCWPTVLPTSPAYDPVCTQETRIGSVCRSGHQRGRSSAMVNRSSPSRIWYVAAAVTRELQCGR